MKLTNFGIAHYPAHGRQVWGIECKNCGKSPPGTHFQESSGARMACDRMNAEGNTCRHCQVLSNQFGAETLDTLLEIVKRQGSDYKKFY